jgi:general stress protein 26
MSRFTLAELSGKLSDIDFTMLVTRTEGGKLASRPMSNNGEVEFDGDSYFFAWESSRRVQDISREPKVAMTLQGKSGLLGKPPLMISVQGKGELIRDKNMCAAHWRAELKRWFADGIDTPGLVMVKVSASRIHYWDGEDEGEFVVGSNGQLT